MKKHASISLFVILVFVIPGSVFAFFQLYEKKLQRLAILSEPIRIDTIALWDQEGKQFTGDKWNDRLVVADFFFSRCPTVCPKMTHNMQAVQQYFKNDPDIWLTSISVDPEADSSEQLKGYCIRRKIDTGNWSFLTGKKTDIYRLARNRFKIVATDGDGGPGDFIHSEKLILLDRKGRIRGYYDGTSETETEQLINDLKKLRNEK